MNSLPLSPQTFISKIALSFFIAFIAIPIGQSCGPPSPRFYGYTFIHSNIVNTDVAFAPFVFRFDDFYKKIKKDQQNTTSLADDNIMEWCERFCNLVKAEDVQHLVYESSSRDLELLKTAIKSKAIGVPPRLQSNSFAHHLEINKCMETVDYLLFAKTCQPHVVKGDSWQTPTRDTLAMEKLIQKGKKQFKKIDSHYIRLRYAFQLIRLAHYKKNYHQVLELHDYLMPKVDAHASIIYDWILGHKAGAIQQLGDPVKAAYLYALIFKDCRSKRTQAFQSFSIKTDEQWDSCLQLCNSDEERATLFVIRASHEESKALEEMQAIYTLDYANHYLELLLLKEIRKLEKQLLGLEFNPKRKENKRYYKLPHKNVAKYLIQVQQFVEFVLREAKIPNIELWKIADGYLEFLAGDYYASDLTFRKVQDDIIDENLKDQLGVFQLALEIATHDKIEEEDEEAIGEIMTNNDFYIQHEPEFHDFILDKLSYQYKEHGDLGKAFRCLYSFDDLKYNPDLAIIDDLLTVCSKESRTRLEDLLVTKDGVLMDSYLQELKGTYYLKRLQLETAAQLFKQIPRNDRDEKPYNPFRDEIQDCVHCPMPDDTIRYDKFDLIERILELDYQGRAQLDMGAYSFYKVGLAYYNMSYYGNCWMVTDYFRSGANWKYRNDDNIYRLESSPAGNRENKDCSIALYYFEKAFLLAKTRELAARAAFMAAKCEQNTWFASKGCKYSLYSNKVPNVPDKYRKFFKILKDDYKDTELYAQIIKECKYFRLYALK